MDECNGLYGHIVASIIDGIILVSRQGTFEQANLATEEMFRQSRDSFLGKPLTEFFPDQPEVLAKVQTSLTSGTSFRDIECRGFRKSKPSHFPVSLTVSPFLGEDQAIHGAVLLVRDMSLLKEMEENSRQMDNISKLGVLSLGMAHEIKNPLVAISGSAQLLRSRVHEEHHQFLDVVIKEADRINRMVERMLSFARPANLDFRAVNIHQVLEEIILLEKKSCGGTIRFIQNYDPSLPSIEANEDRLKQVFLNLIRNAVEAMPTGGDITLTTRLNTHYSVRTPQNPNPHQELVVEITDTGPGIPKNEIKNLFTPFHTTKSKGSGLGLPISLKIVEDHGGKIKVVSEAGKGATFQVFLPVRQG